MFLEFVFADLTRNLPRTLAAMVGVILGVGLFSAVLFFVDGLSASLSQRAVAGLPIDMQHILTDPVAGDLEMRLAVSPGGPVAPGSMVEVTIEIANAAAVPAHEVTLRSAPPSEFDFVDGSAVLDGVPLPAGSNPLRHGISAMGLNVGTLDPGQRLRLSYTARANAVATASPEDFAGSFSTREAFIPVPANRDPETDISELAAAIAGIDGVAAAQPVLLADLPAGALAAGGRGTGPVRVFGFAPGYLRLDPSARIIAGASAPGKAMLSAEAAVALDVAPGDRVTLALPDGTTLGIEVAAVLDLTGAKALFASRRGADLEAFVYTPDAVVLDLDVFTDRVLPAFAAAASTRGGLLFGPPIREIDIRVDRERLNADPETALAQTRDIAAAVRALSERRDFLLDNVSNTLAVAAIDAQVVKRMFVFLGLPGALLAALLAAYAGLVLGGAQRRERATLRIRGAGRSDLLKMLALRVSFMAVIGTLAGTALGLATAAATLGPDALARVQAALLVGSALLSGIVGTAATGAALYLTGRRSIDREINVDRAELERSTPSLWRRWPEVWLLVVVAAITLVAFKLSAFEGTPGSVYVGRPVSLPLWLLVLPIGVWLAGTLLAGRVVGAVLGQPRHQRTDLADRPLRLVVTQTLHRRAAPIVEAAMIVALIVALAVGLGIFANSYDRAKSDDARYFIGGDLRVAFAPSRAGEARTADADLLAALEGVASATPVVFGTHNSVVRSVRTSELVNLAAIDPASFAETAPVDDAAFPSGSAAATLSLLNDAPDGILLSADMARFLKAKAGATIHTLFGRGTVQQREAGLRLVGTFERLPGFPDGVQAVVSTATWARMVDPVVPSFFALRLERASPEARSVLAAKLLGESRMGPLRAETSDAALLRDRSSIAGLNIRGLLSIDRAFATGMAAAAVAIFVFGLILQRRREYVALLALGMMPGAIRLVIGAEVAVVVAAGTTAGLAVGAAMSVYYVGVLRPLFVLAPTWDFAAADIVILLTVVALAALAATLVATSLINRMKPGELLRDD